jgi:hypothetical protein
MRKTKGHVALQVAAGILTASAASVVFAGDFDDFSVHGFGTQTYYQTSANTYMNADRRGTWDNNFLGLVGSFKINDKATLWAQLEAQSTDSHFTWFFVNFQLTERSTVLVGRVKLPLGIYNETVDTTFLQQSSLPPALYQPPGNFVIAAYDGVGYDYEQRLERAGRITWQFYGGQIWDPGPPPTTRDKRIYGGRVTYTTPVEGLRFMLSAARRQIEVLATGNLINESIRIASVDYLSGAWDLKSEYGSHKDQGGSSNTYYVQAGRDFATRWTVFARYDHVTLDQATLDQVTPNQASVSSASQSQSILVAGLNYKVRSNVSLRIENHFNRGYALPVASGEVAPGAGKNDWNLLVVGMHFVF